jgi:hypothetical protein
MDGFRSMIGSSALLAPLLAALALAGCGGGSSGGSATGQELSGGSPEALSAEQALVDDCGAPDASAIFSDVFDRDVIGPGWLETGAAATIDHDVGCPGASLKLAGNPAQARTNDSFASLNRAFTIDMRLDPGAGESDSASFTVVQAADDAHAGFGSVRIESGNVIFSIHSPPNGRTSPAGGATTGTISNTGGGSGGVGGAAASDGSNGDNGTGTGAGTGGTGGVGGIGSASASIDLPPEIASTLQIGNDGLFHRYRFTIDSNGKAVWAKGSPGDVYEIVLTCEGFSTAGPMIMKVAGTAAHFDNAGVSALP